MPLVYESDFFVTPEMCVVYTVYYSEQDFYSEKPSNCKYKCGYKLELQQSFSMEQIVANCAFSNLSQIVRFITL